MKVGCVGRGGRLPCIMANITATDALSANGIAPVNICVDTKQQSVKALHSRSSATCLNHDHRKREGVRFLAICFPAQDLWRSPSHGVTVVTRGTPHGIQVLSDRSKAKIRDPRMTEVVHKDVWLVECQCNSETRFLNNHELL